MSYGPITGLIACLLLVAQVAMAGAETCTRDAARRLVDEAGARLRVLTSETQPKVQARVRQLKEKRGWTGPDADEKVAAIMSDARAAELDSKAASLLMRIDELSEFGTSETVDCKRIGDLEVTSLELHATVRAKSEWLITLLDRELKGETAPSTVAKTEAAPAPPVAPAKKETAPAPKLAPGKQPAPGGQAAPKREQPPAKAARPPEAKTITGWATETTERPLPAPAPMAPGGPRVAKPLPPAPMPKIDQEASEGFSAEEIAQASRGFFGTISSGLGNVIEHAFSTLGRPTAYVLGNEGGGAFIAGVRYGKGRLFMRNGLRREVYWHGPSIGYDIGASGSKTIFLVYNLRNEYDIFTGYSGVDGSAYLVGGVGMTVLTDGNVVMAPIRSGLGIRLGANIGYVRFTARPTWNPF